MPVKGSFQALHQQRRLDEPEDLLPEAYDRICGVRRVRYRLSFYDCFARHLKAQLFPMRIGPIRVDRRRLRTVHPQISAQTLPDSYD